MEIKEWITVASVIAIITGWFVNGSLNRQNEIAKKRFEYRMTALQSYLKVWFFIQQNPSPFTDPLFLPLIEEARSNFQLYGKDDEILLYEKFISSIENHDVQQANEALNSLVQLVRIRVRNELKI